MIILLFTACSPKLDTERLQLLQTITEKVIVSGYTNLEDSTKLLHEGVITYCTSPSESGLLEIQELWWDSRKFIKEMEYGTFGPYWAPPDRVGPKLDFWPVRTESIDDVLIGDLNLDATLFASYGASIKGFPALEYLLYGTDDRSNPRYCEYIEVMAQDLVVQSTALRSAWDINEGGYLSNTLDPNGIGITNEAVDTFLTELVNQLGHAIADIRTLKLQKPIGESIGSPQFENMESRFSHRSLMDIHDNIVGIQTVFNGNNSDGLVKYTQANNMGLAEEFNNRSQHCIELIQTMNQQGTLEEAILIDTLQIDVLSDSLGYLQQFIQEDMLMSLSLWLTFNDSDGD